MLSNKRQKRSGYRKGGGEKLGRVERGETVIRLYYVRKKIFSTKGLKLKTERKEGRTEGWRQAGQRANSYEKYRHILASTGSEK